MQALRQRIYGAKSVGYEPRMIPPDTFYDLYGKLCEVCNTEGALSPKAENTRLDLIDRIHPELLLPGKEDLILSILVDTFISKISLLMRPVPNPHNTVCVSA